MKGVNIMEIIATIPPPYMEHKLKQISGNALVKSVRFNVGARSDRAPLQTLDKLLDITAGREFWLDIKGRQLRITNWAVPTYGDIELNHNINVDLPAKIVFRDNEESYITSINGNKIFVDPNPAKAVGNGQAINIQGNNLKIDGYLTDEDREYLSAAKKLGIKNIMLSFVEEMDDLTAVWDIIPDAHLVLKIESIKGLDFIESLECLESFSCVHNVHLMAARDDLLTNLARNREDILKATRRIIQIDSNAIVASRLLTSFLSSPDISLGDICDLSLLKSWKYNRFMLSDSLCFNFDAFERALEFLGGRYYHL